MENFVSVLMKQQNQATLLSLKTISRFQNLVALSKLYKKLTSQNLTRFLKRSENEFLLKSPSLVGVFTVHMKKACVLSYPLSASEDSDQTGWTHRLI